MKAFLWRVSRWWWLALLGSLVGAFLLPCMMGTLDEHGQINKVFSDLDGIDTALELYRQKTGDYPAEAQGLESLRGVAIKRVWKDPWGAAYVYSRPTPSIRPFVYSIGADQVDSGGAGDDVAARDKPYRCEDYGINCGPDFLDVAAIGVGVLFILSLLAGLARGIVWVVRRTSTPGA